MLLEALTIDSDGFQNVPKLLILHRSCVRRIIGLREMYVDRTTYAYLHFQGLVTDPYTYRYANMFQSMYIFGKPIIRRKAV